MSVTSSSSLDNVGPVKIFFCYAREDEKFRQMLEEQMGVLHRQGLIDIWHDRRIDPGTEWEREIDKRLNDAQIILLLVSRYFIASDYCYGVEMRRAMERHERGEVRVIPIILRPTLWKDAPFGKLQALPTDAVPVTSRKWRTKEDAFHDIAQGIHEIVHKIFLASLPTQQKSNIEASGKDLIQAEHTYAIKVFFCYARADKKMRSTLEKHFRALRDSGQMTTWFDREIVPGTDWTQEIDLLHINNAELVLLLISSDFLDSGYLQGKEMGVTFYRQDAANLPILCIMLRPTTWRGTEISELDKLPVDGIPITRWVVRDDAFVNIAEDVRGVVNQLLAQKQMPGRSAISQKWTDSGWSTEGIIPVTDELVCFDGVGHYQHFANVETGFQGTIFWHPDPDIGVHAIQGNIRKKWLDLRWWETAPIYPTTDEIECSDGIGHYNHFRRIDFLPELYYLNDISLYSYPTLGTHETHGAIRHHWMHFLGAEQYGYPVTDEQVCPDGIGRLSTFRNPIDGTENVLSWHQATGVKRGPC